MKHVIPKDISSPGTFEGMSRYRPPLCFELEGRTFDLVMDDGYDCVLSFKDRSVLEFGVSGESREYFYDCLKADENTYFVNFEMEGQEQRTGMSLILDMEQSLVTACRCTIGSNPKWPRMPRPEFIFGGIRKEDGTVPSIRHGYTNEMVGRAISWEYGTLNAVHVYSSERYYRLTVTEEMLERVKRDNPDEYGFLSTRNQETIDEEPVSMIKVKEGIFIFGANEEMLFRTRGTGNNLLFLMNLNRMYDVGRSFGYNAEGNPENYTFGAFGKYYDASELLARDSTEYIR